MVLAASPTLTTYCPGEVGTVLVNRPGVVGDKKKVSPASNVCETATCPAVITLISVPAAPVTSEIPHTVALSNVSLAMALPIFPSLALQNTASPWVILSKHYALNTVILKAMGEGFVDLKSIRTSTKP